MEWHDMANFVIDIVTAIATLGATLLALYLALRDGRQRIDCVFMWETATEDKPMIILNNIGDRTVIVERVDLIFDGHKICSVDVLRRLAYSKNAIISPNKEVKIVLNKPFTHNRVVSLKRLFSETSKDFALGDKNNRECVLMIRKKYSE